MLVKFEQNCMIQNKKKKKKKNLFLNHFRQSVDAILEDVSVALTVV